MEDKNFRDDKGRLMSGHKGLKPKGANNRLQAEIKEKITEFLSGKIETLEEIYSEVGAKDKLRFITELLAYVLPKSKELTIESNYPEQSTYIDFKSLSPSALKEILNNTHTDDEERP